MKKNGKMILGLLGLIISAPVLAANVWTGYHEVDYIRTYDGKDFSIALKGLSCPNQKNYYFLREESYDKQAMISLVMVAKAQGARINVLYNPDVDSTHCYIHGITIE